MRSGVNKFCVLFIRWVNDLLAKLLRQKGYRFKWRDHVVGYALSSHLHDLDFFLLLV